MNLLSFIKFEEETNEILHLKHSFVWCRNLGKSEDRSYLLRKVWNIVLEKDGEDQSARSCEK